MKIAILSRNANLYSTKRLIEAGKQRGHEMLVLDHQMMEAEGQLGILKKKAQC